jgi:DNA-binding response OmpR family regulator
MTRILIVEDNEDLARGLANNFEIEGFDSRIASDGDAAIRMVSEYDPDLLILDLMLPGLDGYTVLQRLRDEGNTVPVLILTARSAEYEKVRGFTNGADDYVTKPFGLMELLGRVKALLRRAGRSNGMSAQEAVIRFGDVEVTPGSHDVIRGGKPVTLRPKEFELLMALARRRGNVAGRMDLLREVWGYGTGVVSRTVDTHIGELRRKLEVDPAAPNHIITVRKTGYRLDLTGP